MANVPITSLPEATSPSANDYLILQGESTQKIKWSVLLDKLYPVGCIYQSASSTSPASFLGGTWEQIKDRFILAAGDTYAAGSTGGEAAVTLTNPEQNAPHSHALKSAGENPGTYTLDSALLVYRDSSKTTDYIATNGVYSISQSGGGKSHNNMPPYTTMYIWQRIA